MVVDQAVRSDAELDAVFHALADSTRRDIVARVMRSGESVSALAGRYEMSFAAVQKHVAVLERAALVRKERRGREQIVHGVPTELQRTRALLEQYEQVWRSRHDRMADLLGETPGPGVREANRKDAP